MNKTLVILSGGQDSTACLAMVAKHRDVAAITFDYGQRHRREIQAAKDIAQLCGVRSHEIVTLGDSILAGTSPLTDKNQILEQYETYASMDLTIGDRVEKTFVPMRNALFLTIAANRAVCMGANNIITGVCEADNANYPDCRLSFIMAQEVAINEALGNNRGTPNYIVIETPLIRTSKAQSIKRMISDGSYPLLAFTHTAYDGQYPPLGSDHATVLRAQGFLDAGVPDPLIVRAWMEGYMDLPETPNYQDGGDPLRNIAFDALVKAITQLQQRLNTSEHP